MQWQCQGYFLKDIFYKEEQVHVETIHLNCSYICCKCISIAVGVFSLLHMTYSTISKCLWCLWEVLFIIGHLEKLCIYQR